MTAKGGSTQRSDLPTLAAAGLVVYAVADLVHEGVGHGGACVATGRAVQGISTAWLYCQSEGLPRDATRMITAGGTVANLALGAVLLGVLRARPQRTPLGFTLWLGMVVNLLQGGGYLMVSPLIGYGDWSAFLRGYPPTTKLVLQVVLSLGGLAISVAAVLAGRRQLAAFLPAGSDVRREARRLCFVPYLAGVVLFLVASLRDPLRGVAFTGVLAAQVCGTCWLVVMLPFLVKEGGAGVAVSRSRGVLVAGAVASLACILVFGPGLGTTPE